MWCQKIKYYMSVLIVFVMTIKNPGYAFECGMRKVNVNSAIVSGQQTYPGYWPWHVAVYHQEYSADKYVCGGTLISELFVLSADHCVRDNNNHVISSRRIFVRLGLHNLRDINLQSLQQHNLQRIHTYSHSKQLKNDIVLLEMSTQAEFTDFVQPACLNQQEDLTGKFGIAIGWGFDETGETSQILKSQKMPVVSTNECLEVNEGAFRLVLDRNIFCAGYTNGTTVCNGDSGGGLHFKINQAWYVGGIVSFTAPEEGRIKCHLKSYAGFTNVQRYLPWIQKVAGLRFIETTQNEDYMYEPKSQNVEIRKNSDRIAVSKPKQYSNLLPQDCGRYVVNRISGGINASYYEFPWIALLIQEDPTTREPVARCHGSIISKRYILTTAGCVLEVPYKRHYIRMGEYDLENPAFVFADIENVTVHPNLNHVTAQNDIALIRLERDIEFNDFVQPICLPVTKLLRKQTLKMGIVAGFGEDENGLFSPIMRKALVSVIRTEECRRMIDPINYLGDSTMCTAGQGRPNPCRLDLGTPLGYVFRYRNRIRFIQYGITNGVGCGTGAPSSYVYLPYLMDWVLANLRP